MAYAENTAVPVEKSMGEIVGMVKRAGAERIAQMEDTDQIAIEFYLKNRRLRFRVNFPTIDQMPKKDGRGSFLTDRQRADRAQGAKRQRARALLLVIKAKLESVESGVESFDEAFLPNVVMPDNKTVWERIREPMMLECQTGKPASLMLEGPAQ